MIFPAILFGFLIGQVVTVDGFYFRRVSRWVLVFLFTILLALLPLFLTFGLLVALGLERSPFVLLSIGLLVAQGTLEFLQLFSHAIEME